jgi:predicted nucleic acid-binding Zn ribbon protein
MLPLPPRRIPPKRAGKISAQQRALAQWRGIDLAPLQKAQHFAARPISAWLPKVLSKAGVDRHCSEVEVLKVWSSLIDPNVVKHAQPTGLRNGTLFVTVDSSVWLSDIVRYRRKEILERLQHSFGREFIARISFRLG